MAIGTILNTPSSNGTAVNKFGEVGSPGIESWAGYIRQAYHEDLYWPDCFPIFNRIRRSDSEIGGIVRPAYVTLARQTTFDWELPEDPSDDDKRAQEYGRQLMDDMEGGADKFIEEVVSYTPFMGFGWWEVVMGVRNPKWKAPGDDPWRSSYDDGLPAVRRLAFRDHASFHKWEINDYTGRVSGMWQLDPPNPAVLIPKDRSLHLTFGDPNNPEGLSPLEAVWRLERIKYGLEIVQGIGYEHTAGYLKVTAEQALTTDDKTAIKKAARAVMAGQESNFLMVPKGVDANIIDVNFAAAPAILEAIRYYGLLKLQVYNMQFVAMATTANTGSYSAHSDSAEMGLMSFNGMMEGMAKQIDAQLGRRIFEHPAVLARFPGMTRRPRAVITPIEKVIPLTELSAFVQAISPLVPMDDDDIIAIRRKSGFLPETLPEADTVAEEPEDTGTADEIPEIEEGADMATAVKRAQIFDNLTFHNNIDRVLAAEMAGYPSHIIERIKKLRPFDEYGDGITQ